MIRSFISPDTEALYNGKRVSRLVDIERVATRKLQMLDDAAALQDLKSPSGNHLEALKGDRKGQYSIRINDQWRLCFAWTDSGADRVEIVDYH